LVTAESPAAVNSRNGKNTDADKSASSCWSNSLDLELAAVYAPREHVSGPECAPGIGYTGRTIDLSMQQFEVTAGFKYRFGDASASLK
jgi:hypothetical protein